MIACCAISDSIDSWSYLDYFWAVPCFPASHWHALSCDPSSGLTSYRIYRIWSKRKAFHRYECARVFSSGTLAWSSCCMHYTGKASHLNGLADDSLARLFSWSPCHTLDRSTGIVCHASWVADCGNCLSWMSWCHCYCCSYFACRWGSQSRSCPRRRQSVPCRLLYCCRLPVKRSFRCQSRVVHRHHHSLYHRFRSQKKLNENFC